eukprot:TRINITY_DN15448_c1_g1_i1.p1 TRINITY_DN15448_c1_g1~~TRINITY_DN15448_c1_g1_i1.p1  ORF type:complete len:1910 (+),score=438.15 TRINITY_DN15448_c1_g1_i1:102-5732(+)
MPLAPPQLFSTFSSSGLDPQHNAAPPAATGAPVDRHPVPGAAALAAAAGLPRAPLLRNDPRVLAAAGLLVFAVGCFLAVAVVPRPMHADGGTPAGDTAYRTLFASDGLAAAVVAVTLLLDAYRGSVRRSTLTALHVHGGKILSQGHISPGWHSRCSRGSLDERHRSSAATLSTQQRAASSVSGHSWGQRRRDRVAVNFSNPGLDENQLDRQYSTASAVSKGSLHSPPAGAHPRLAPEDGEVQASGDDWVRVATGETGDTRSQQGSHRGSVVDSCPLDSASASPAASTERKHSHPRAGTRRAKLHVSTHAGQDGEGAATPRQSVPSAEEPSPLVTPSATSAEVAQPSLQSPTRAAALRKPLPLGSLRLQPSGSRSFQSRRASSPPAFASPTASPGPGGMSLSVRGHFEGAYTPSATPQTEVLSMRRSLSGQPGADQLHLIRGEGGRSPCRCSSTSPTGSGMVSPAPQSPGRRSAAGGGSDAPRSALAREAGASTARAARLRSFAAVLKGAQEDNMKSNLLISTDHFSNSMGQSAVPGSDNSARTHTCSPQYNTSNDVLLSSPEESAKVALPQRASHSSAGSPPQRDTSLGSVEMRASETADSRSGHRERIEDEEERQLSVTGMVDSGPLPTPQLPLSLVHPDRRHSPYAPVFCHATSSMRASSQPTRSGNPLIPPTDSCLGALMSPSGARPVPLIEAPPGQPGGGLLVAACPAIAPEEDEPSLDELQLQFNHPFHEAEFRLHCLLRERTALVLLLAAPLLLGGGAAGIALGRRAFGLALCAAAPPLLEAYLFIRLRPVEGSTVLRVQLAVVCWGLICALVYAAVDPGDVLLEVPLIAEDSSGPAMFDAFFIVAIALALRPLFWWAVANASAVVAHAVMVGLIIDPLRDEGQLRTAAYGAEALAVAAVVLVFIYRGEVRRRRSFATNLLLRVTVARCRAEQRRALHLIKSCLPRRVYDTMISSGSAWTGVCAQVHHSVVLATDLASFTTMCSGMSAYEVVRLLNKLFTNCDYFAQLYGVEKVKTLGDAWIAAVHPAVTESHYGAAADLALAICSCVVQLAETQYPGLRVRVGVGHGSLLSGMAGVHRPQYEILGQALDDAVKMEQTCIPQRAQVSEGVAQVLLGCFAVDEVPVGTGGSGKFLSRRVQSSALSLGPAFAGQDVDLSDSSPQCGEATVAVAAGPPGAPSVRDNGALLRSPRTSRLRRASDAMSLALLGGLLDTPQNSIELLGEESVTSGLSPSGTTEVAFGRGFGGAATAVVRATFVNLDGTLRAKLHEEVAPSGMLRLLPLRFASPVEEVGFRSYLRQVARRRGVRQFHGLAMVIAAAALVADTCRAPDKWPATLSRPRPSVLLAAAAFGAAAAAGVIHRQIRTGGPVAATSVVLPEEALFTPTARDQREHQSEALGTPQSPRGAVWAARAAAFTAQQVAPFLWEQWNGLLHNLDLAENLGSEWGVLVAASPMLAVPCAALTEKEVAAAHAFVFLLVGLFLVVLHPSLVSYQKAPVSITLVIVAGVCFRISGRELSASMVAVLVMVGLCGLYAAHRSEVQRRKTWHDQRRLAAQQGAIDRNVGLSERMLLNAVPEAVLQAVGSGDADVVHDVEEATIGFLLFDNLLAIDESSCPAIVLPTLNSFLGALDALIACHPGVEKLKNLPYVVVAGCPVPDMAHARAVSGFALAAVARVRQYNETHGTQISVKAGVHSGRLTAGILGGTNFIYDVFGDSVNLASRLASNGIEGKVQISQEVIDLVPSLRTKRRGRVHLKGKGDVDCFIVLTPADPEYLEHPETPGGPRAHEGLLTPRSKPAPHPAGNGHTASPEPAAGARHRLARRVSRGSVSSPSLPSGPMSPPASESTADLDTESRVLTGTSDAGSRPVSVA